jgi:alkylation response protein AidB-like acyl-CoA dehydrogenase
VTAEAVHERETIEEFRLRARAWLAANAPRRAGDTEGEQVGSGGGLARQKAFQAQLYDAGFVGITWPAEYGGQGRTNAEQIAFSQ